ncbi:unnamed protein product [Moneuplotes crassus]|uniref:Uncharacterized protein n=1 Tax=Euplotes crassus TaxID=5936 RepID=A0AAD1U465_EUPCR|nr:unnamed protein product [Moneuplotes crassus]
MLYSSSLYSKFNHANSGSLPSSVIAKEIQSCLSIHRYLKNKCETEKDKAFMSEVLFIVLNCGFLCFDPEEADSLHTQISNLVRRCSHEDPDYLLMKILDNLVQYCNVNTPSEIMSKYFSGCEPKNAKEEAISPDSHYQMSQPGASTHTSEFCICQSPIAIANDPRIVLSNMLSSLKTPKMEEFGLYHKQEAQLMENALKRIFMKRRVENAKIEV